MKKNNSRIRFATPLLALALAASAHAGSTETTTAAPMTPPAEDMISGVLNLDFNSHFISYGNDAWHDGSSLSDPTFNPSLELSLKLPAGFTATLGTWWDVNSKAGGNSSPLGGRIQEVDVWAGLAYTIDKFTTKVTYQAWNYGSDTEDILDVAFSYDCFLSPSITVHNRLEAGSAAGSYDEVTGFSNGDEGTVIVGALSYSIEAGPVTFSFPFNIAYFVTDEFHAVGADDGLGYGSIGANASMPLSFIDETYGKWSIHGGLTYYVTDRDVIPNNPKGDFLTANIGLTVGF
jgi:hypothetical protein